MRRRACWAVCLGAILAVGTAVVPRVQADDPISPDEQKKRFERVIELYSQGMKEFRDGNLRKAVELNKDALAACERLYPPETHPDGHSVLVRVLNSLSASLESDGQSEVALGHAERAVKICDALNAEKAGAGGIRELSLALTTLGNIHGSLDHPDRGIPYLERGLRLRKQLFPEEDNPLLAVSHSNLAAALEQAGRLPEALSHAIASCEICERVRAGKAAGIMVDRMYLGCLLNRAAILDSLGRPEEALALFQKSDEIEAASPDAAADGSALISHLNTRATILTELGRPTKALGYLIRAMDVANEMYPSKTYPDGHVDLITTLTNVAVAMGKLGAPEALSVSRRALDLCERRYPVEAFPSGHSQLAAAISARGSILADLGEASAAERLLVRAAEMYALLYPPATYPNGHPDLADAFVDAARACSANGRIDREISYLERSLAIRRKVYSQLPDGHPNLALGLSDLGGALATAGQGDRALPYCLEAMRMLQGLPQGASRPEVVHAFDNIGYAYAIIHRPDLALSCFRRAVEVATIAYPADEFPSGHRDDVARLSNLASVCRTLGRMDEAIDYSLRAVKAAETLYPERLYPRGHVKLIAVLVNQAVGLTEAGRPADALGVLHRVLKLAEAFYSDRDYPDGHPVLAAVHHNLGEVYLSLKDPRAAAIHLEKSVRMTASLLQQYADQLPEAEALDYADRLPGSRDSYLRATRQADSPPSTTYAALWDSRAAVTRVLRARHFAKDEPSGVQPLRDKLAGVRAELTGLRLSPSTDDNRERRITDLAQQAAKVEQDLLATLRKTNRPADPGTPADLAKALSPGSAFVDILRHEEKDQAGLATPHYTAFVIAPNASVVRVPLGSADPIDRAVNGWRGNLLDWARPDLKPEDRVAFEKQADARAEELRKRVWEPLVPFLPAGGEDVPSAVFLAVEGDLARLPFAALPNGPSDGFLLDRYMFANVMHGPYLLERLRSSPALSRPEKILVVGNVDYGPGPVKVLAGSRNELIRLQNVIGERATPLSDREATPAAVAQALEHSDAAHISTHAEFREKDLRADRDRAAEYRSGLREFDLRTMVLPIRVGVGARNPLGYTGLALAGLNRREGPDAGVLTGEVIVGLRLEHLRLAVLSACETGVGDNTGSEGVSGLQRAFHLAGCPDVVATLWTVDDEATVALVNVFWDHVLDTNTPLPPARALWKAQRLISTQSDLIPAFANRGPGQPGTVKVNLARDSSPKPTKGERRTRAHPYLWAAFFLSGAGR